MSLSPIAEPAHVFGNASIATIPVVAAIAGSTISIHKLVITASAATTVTIQDTSGALLSQAFPMSGSKALILDTNDNGDPWFTAVTGLGIQLAQSGSANIGFDAFYIAGVAAYGVPPGTPHVPVLVPTTWNPADSSHVNLTNANLTETSTTNAAGVRAIAGSAAGKYYFEMTLSPWHTGFAGLALAAAGLGTNSTNAVGLNAGGQIWINNAASGTTISLPTTNDAVAVDLNAQLIWFRNLPSGNWNNNAANNPATGVGGLSISALSGTLYPWASNLFSGDAVTANFGGSAFIGAVPAGFTAGWGVMQ